MATSPGPAGAASPASVQGAQALLAARSRKGASWFYWIAGLSVANSAIAHFGGNVHFVVGLGITEVFDALTREGPSALSGWLVSLCVAGVFVLCGYQAVRQKNGAFVGGMVVYGLDAALTLFASDYFATAFHAYVLFMLYQGWRALGELKKLESPGAFPG